MVPYVHADEYVIIRSLSSYKKGDVIVCNTNYYGKIIKRISFINKNIFFVKSDNKYTYSSLCELPHNISQISGKVILKFSLSKLNFKLYYIKKVFKLVKNKVFFKFHL